MRIQCDARISSWHVDVGLKRNSCPVPGSRLKHPYVVPLLLAHILSVIALPGSAQSTKQQWFWDLTLGYLCACSRSTKQASYCSWWEQGLGCGWVWESSVMGLNGISVSEYLKEPMDTIRRLKFTKLFL